MSVAIALLLLDVDGVLTDGRMIFAGDGETQKSFHAKDGHRIRMAIRAGLPVGLLSGRDCPALRYRAADLGLDPCLLGVGDKVAALEAHLAVTGLSSAEVAYIGDDLPDAGLLGRVGRFYAVADAHPRVLACCQVVLRSAGGHGAVAEAIEGLLRERGAWHPADGDAGIHA